MVGKQYRHIFLTRPPHSHNYTNPRRGGSTPRIPERDRVQHSSDLQGKLESAWSEVQNRQSVVVSDRHGAYLDFKSDPGFDLKTDSLEARSSGIRLLNVRKVGEPENEETIATVYIPHNKRSYFLGKINEYANQQTKKKGKPKNEKLINSIADIRVSILESFWTDDKKLLPNDTPGWVEVWLSSDRDYEINRFNALLNQLRIERIKGILKFPERAVEIIIANREKLEQLIECSDDVAELRLAKEVASYYFKLENKDQVDLVKQLLGRTKFDSDTNIAICILDTGINNGHLLIRPVLDDKDLQTVRQEWGVDDHSGHGTLMAGLAAYGDLLTILNSNNPLIITHRLESAKILPPNQQNPKNLWGYITAQGVSLSEIQAPHRDRIICLAVTSSDDRDKGKPTSWSAKIDELASGCEDNTYRLFVISAGNVDESINWRNYPDDNKTNKIHDPGQSWNALTVGAYTEKTRITDPTYKSWTPVAPFGGLSPYSTTSSSWSPQKWPIKPEVLFEGGNVARGPNDSFVDIDDLQLLSTWHKPHDYQFGLFGKTSAATAQAAWLAAQIKAQYPDAWPETIRALIVHSANWTPSMIRQFLQSNSKADYAKFLRICGYGVPDLANAIYSASDSLTLISQAKLRPFEKRDTNYVTRDMHLYNLPWPKDVLKELAEIPVKMRVTLSYFIEPGPGEIGWGNRYRYASHGLRFDVNRANESESEFIARINSQARDETEYQRTREQSNWLIGEARNVGSIHSDIWVGRAIDLGESNKIAVYPTVGWWRERHYLNKWDKQCRYSLVVSIQTPGLDVDIYTPVAIQVGIAVPIELSVDDKM